jgi:ABC transporter substrate binding protein
MHLVRIIGSVDPDGSFTPGRWSAPSAEVVSAAQAKPSSETRWAAVALDEADQILARAQASLVAVSICSVGSRLELGALLALPDATSSVAILDGDREVYRRAVPEPARVSLAKPLGKTLRRQLIEVRVRIDGPEPRSGAYIVLVWEAPGHPTLPLGLIDLGAGEPAVVHLDLSELPGGEGCRLSATYCDGIRVVAVSSGPLSIGPRPAVPRILAPTSGMELFDDSWLSLEGHLDGDGDPRALKRMAAMVDKILKGAKPADIPVEQSTKFEFVVNIRTAKQLGLTIPPEYSPERIG